MTSYYHNQRQNMSGLGMRSQSEFTMPICDAFCGSSFSRNQQTTSGSASSPQEERSNWQCTPLCLNAIFCSYCLLARQAHMIYQDEALQRQLAVRSQRRVDSMLSGLDHNNNSHNNYSGSSKHHHHHQGSGGADAVNHQSGAAAANNASFEGSHFSGASNYNSMIHATELLRDSSFLEHGVDDECCCCHCSSCASCIIPMKTCMPKFMLCLDNNLPPTCHWTCLSALAIDAGSITTGALLPITLGGIWMTGLSMQALLTRHLVRRRLGMGSATLNDFAVSMCCPCLAAVQQYQEMTLKRHRAGLREGLELVVGDEWLSPDVLRGGGGDYQNPNAGNGTGGMLY